MSRVGDERGAGLIILIGVIAALAVMATSLVALTANVQNNTYTDRMRAKSFNVTEAAVDSAMYELNAKWPATSGTGPAFDTAWKAAYRSAFAKEEFPDPTVGQFVTVDYYDNQATVDPNIKYDKGQPDDPNLPDNKMWLVTQSGVGPKAARITVLVERQPYNVNMPRGVALCAGGNLYSNGGGNNPKIYVEVPPPLNVGGGVTSIHVGGVIEASDVAQTGIVRYAPGEADPLNQTPKTPDEVFPPSLVGQLGPPAEGLVGLALQHDRYFTSAAAADASPMDPTWSPQGGISGLCVIDDPAGYTIRGDYNTEAQPGVFLLLGGGDFDYGGGGDFYGVIYTRGTILKGHGEYGVHGMIVVASNQDMRGTTDLFYNDNAIANLMGRFALTVKQVPGTWREIRPQ